MSSFTYSFYQTQMLNIYKKNLTSLIKHVRPMNPNTANIFLLVSSALDIICFYCIQGPLHWQKDICGFISVMDLMHFRFSKWWPSAVSPDHPQLVFDGPNILLKLHVDRVWFEIAYSRPFLRIFWGYYPK